MKERWLKSELHTHCIQDPKDYRFCDYEPEVLIDHAARLGYEVLAITCHNRDIWNRELAEYAATQGITLIPGMEVILEKRFHTLAYNFHKDSDQIDTFAKLRANQGEETLVIAPHPYFPAFSCLGRQLKRNMDLFDAIECSGFYLSCADFNRRARNMALKHRKPLVGNGDIHFLWQLGKTFSWIYAEPNVSSILAAVKKGLVKVEISPLTYTEAARWWYQSLWHTVFPKRTPSAQIGPVLPYSKSKTEEALEPRKIA